MNILKIKKILSLPKIENSNGMEKSLSSSK